MFPHRFYDHIYTESKKESTNKLFVLISELSKVLGYNVIICV